MKKKALSYFLILMLFIGIFPISASAYEQEQGENTPKIKALRLELKKSDGKRNTNERILHDMILFIDA